METCVEYWCDSKEYLTINEQINESLESIKCWHLYIWQTFGKILFNF